MMISQLVSHGKSGNDRPDRLCADFHACYNLREMTSTKKRILTGDRPTGSLHLGHYVGTLQIVCDCKMSTNVLSLQIYIC